MNILLFVTTMLMLLTLMTYAKLDSFRNAQVFQVLYEHYSEKDERGHINLAAEKTYEKIKIAPKADKQPGKEDKPGKEDNKEKAPKATGTARISLAAFKTRSLRDSKPQEWQQSKLLLKNLMTTLYKDQPFFIEMEHKRPQFLDEMLNGLASAADALPKEKKWLKVQDIANLSLGDPDLDHILYLMSKGAPYKEVVKDTPQPKAESTNEESDDATETPSTEEFKSPKGYYSLFDFVTMNPSQKVRVYLAPKEVLKSIYHSDEMVNEIISERRELYLQAKNGGDSAALTKALESRFDGARDPAISKETLDYTVTKTDPKKYE